MLVLALAVFASVPLTIGHSVPAASAASSRPAVLSRTTVLHVSPVTAGGQLRAGYTVTQHRSHAHCSTGSEATGNAYRCFAGNGVFDPCWVTANKAFVDCLAAPYGHKVARLHVARPYDNAGGLGSAAALPWGLQVRGGTRATLLQGATDVVHGKRINYSLKGFSRVLIGNVNKKHAIWRIQEAHRSAGHYHVTGWVELSKAWFGQRSRKG
jgi:hypothetical protein